MARVQILLEEGIQLSLLGRGQQVHLVTSGFRTWDKFNGMVPWFGLWQHVEGFFGENIIKLMKIVWDSGSDGFTVLFEGLCEPLRDGGGGSDFSAGVVKAGRKHAISLFKLWVFLILVILKECREVVLTIVHHNWEESR